MMMVAQQLRIYLVLLNCTLKTVKMLKFILYIFYHDKKKSGIEVQSSLVSLTKQLPIKNF